MLCVVWLYYAGFDPCSIGSIGCSIAYWLTQSGGKVGTLFAILVTSAFQVAAFSSMKEKALGFMRSFLVLSMLLAVLASLNEFVLKPTLRVARPSHAFILRQSHSDVTLDSVYKLAEVKRKDFFRHLVATDTAEFKKIDPRVLDHWVDEAGYSFPSGHTFNAFLIGPLLAFSLLSSRSRAIRLICFLPLLWALFVGVSRVSLGAHSALDVSVGAVMGLFLAHLLLFFPYTRRLLIPVSTLDTRR